MNKVLKKISNIVKIILGVCLIASSFYFGYNYLNGIFRTPDVNYGDSFHNMPEDSVDVVVLGSSHAQYSFVPSFFYQDTGLYSYSLGTSFQPLSVSYQMLREALKTQNPELVILEIFTACQFVDNTDTDYDYRYVLGQYQMTGEEKYNTIDLIGSKEKAISYKNEFINNHNNWRTVESAESLLQKDTDINTLFGFVGNWDIYLPIGNYWFSTKYDTDLDEELPEEVSTYLNKIYDLCKENNIELLLYMTPMDNVTQQEQTYRHKVWDWANENNIKYLDLLENDYLYDIRSVIHHDGYHTYITGASLVTTIISEFVKENYTVNNHTDNSELDTLYEDLIPSLTVGVLNREARGENIMTRLKDFPSTMLVSYRDLEINENLRQRLDYIGLNNIVEGQKFYGILNDGELIISSSESVNYDIDGHNVVIDDTGIYFDGEKLVNDDTLTFVVFNKDYTDNSIRRIAYYWDAPWAKGYTYEYGLDGE